MNRANARRQAHNKARGKYAKQRIRTDANKAKHIAKAKALKAAADARKKAARS